MHPRPPELGSGARSRAISRRLIVLTRSRLSVAKTAKTRARPASRPGVVDVVWTCPERRRPRPRRSRSARPRARPPNLAPGLPLGALEERFGLAWGEHRSLRPSVRAHPKVPRPFARRFDLIRRCLEPSTAGSPRWGCGREPLRFLLSHGVRVAVGPRDVRAARSRAPRAPRRMLSAPPQKATGARRASEQRRVVHSPSASASSPVGGTLLRGVRSAVGGPPAPCRRPPRASRRPARGGRRRRLAPRPPPRSARRSRRGSDRRPRDRVGELTLALEYRAEHALEVVAERLDILEVHRGPRSGCGAPAFSPSVPRYGRFLLATLEREQGAVDPMDLVGRLRGEHEAAGGTSPHAGPLQSLPLRLPTRRPRAGTAARAAANGERGRSGSPRRPPSARRSR